MEAKDLNAQILLIGYSQGCFPMPDSRDPRQINWYRPNPRAIIPLELLHISRSMRRELRRHSTEVHFNRAFSEVMRQCANRPETWITEDFIRAYSELNAQGFAHSVEIYRNDRLVGGLYGVAIGAAFFAESMFHLEPNTSKLALIKLVERLREKGFQLLECQFLTSHLESMGAIEIEDSEYAVRLANALEAKASFL
ncbi:MAG: leucyl/phenylalanyl-tRNA--protein transferase [Silvanigrellaceae bacterium]